MKINKWKGRLFVKAGRTSPTFTKRAAPISLAAYLKYLESNTPKEEAKRLCLLVGACNIGLHFNDSDMVTSLGQNVMTLPSLVIGAKTLNEKYPLIADSNDTFSSCIDAAKYYYAPAEGLDFDFSFEKESLNLEDSLRTILWILNSNHQYQGDLPHEIANNLILSGIAGFRSLPADTTIIDQHFQKNVGVSAKEYYMTLFSLWALSLKDFVINRKKFLKHSGKKEKLQKALDSILESLSFKVNEPLDSNVFSHAKQYSGKAKAEAILSLKPLVQVHDDIYFSSGSPYLKIQCSRKFLPKALFYARKDNGGNPMSTLSQFVGETRLEMFFKELCNDWTPEQGHFDEYYYDQSQQNKSADRIVFEKHGNHEVATLFQLKGKTLIEAALFGGDFEKIEKDIQSAFSEMIFKSVLYIKRAKELIDSSAHNNQTLEITDRVLKSKKLVLVGISPDVPSIFTSKPIREIVEKKVIEEVGADTWSWLHGHYDRIYWHIISLHEFQAFLRIPKKKQHFYKAIQAYFLDSQLESNPISKSGFPDAFRSYVIKKYGKINDRDQYFDFHPELGAIFNELLSEIKEYFELEEGAS